MAYSSSRGPSRGSSRGGGGGQATVAYAVAGVIVVLVIVVFMVVSNSKKSKPSAVPTGAPPTAAPPPTPPPTKPAGKPFPPISDALLKKGRELATTFDSDGEKAQALYKQANEAKARDDTKTWQSKLHEMMEVLERVKDRWNEFIAEMPRSADYDSEDIAKHYFPAESGRVQKQLKLLSAVKSDVR
jgi:hypothetical protein